MARRINGYDMFIPAAQHQLQMLEEMGGLREDIIAQLAKVSGKSKAELVTIMQEAGVQTLRTDDAIYRAAGLTPAPLTASLPMQQTLQAGLNKTYGLFDNLTKTTANTATKQFERVLDRAYMQVSSGAFSPDMAVKNAIKDLCAQGVEVIRYPTGHVDTMEAAVRRATLTGINQTTGKLQELRMDEMGCDLVEVTAHGGARPEHAKWQGGIFSRSGKSKKYPSLVEVTGYGTGPGLYDVVQMGVTGLDAQLNPITQDKQYIRAGQSTTKTGTQRSFAVSGDRYVGDAFQDFALSHAVKYGTGSAVISPYVYFCVLNGKGEKGKASIIVNSDGAGEAGESAEIDIEIKKANEMPAEYTYSAS